MDKSEIVSVLGSFGLKPQDAKLYLAALGGNRNTVLSLSRVTGMKRGTIYEIVDRLKEGGFLRIVTIDAKRYFEAVNPKDVGERFRESAKSFEAVIPDLLALQPAQGPRPRVTFYEGEDEIWQMYEDTLKEAKPICSYTSIADLYRLLTPRRIESYIKKRADRKIPIRMIALDSPESRQLAQRGPTESRETRLVPSKTHDFAADIEIYSNKVLIISYKENLFGVIIESEQIAEMQRVAFELMWDAAGKSA